MSQPNSLRPDGLLAELLTAVDRDHCPGARPLVSFRDDDEADYLAELGVHAPVRLEVERRGHWYGQFAELEGDDLIPPPGPPREAILAQRWHTARPIVLPGFAQALPSFATDIAARRRLHDELKQGGGLRAFLNEQLATEETPFVVHHRPPNTGDDPRDIERVTLHWRSEPTSEGNSIRDLWAKSAWLSDRDDDESLRLRLSYGKEVAQDASRDLLKHRRISELAEVLLPECALVTSHPWLNNFLEQQIGGAVFFSQHIAYWNGLGGGALMHHDAFHEPLTGGQRGVLYLQLSGRSLWVAASIEDLCRRVIEFAAYLEEGELPWVRQRLFKKQADFEAFLRMCKRFPRVRKELGRPGCGKLGALVNQGPEFMSVLADAGHLSLLRAGDAILLPNQGLELTCMHSVFGISNDPGYALSFAIRERQPPEALPELELNSGAAAGLASFGGRHRSRSGRRGRGSSRRRRR